VQYMIETFKLSGAFQRENIQWLFDNANSVCIPFSIPADGTRVCFGEVLANGAKRNSLFNINNGFGKRTSSGFRNSQNMISKPGGAFRSDAGQLVELLNESSDWFGGSSVFWLQIDQDSDLNFLKRSSCFLLYGVSFS